MRILILLLTAAALPIGSASAAELRSDWEVELELGATTANPDTKLAAEADDAFARLSFLYAATIGEAWSFDSVVDAVTSGSAGIDVTEAYFSWRPVPRSPLRQTFRVGAFYPPLSLENTGNAWTSPYSDSFSAINTWVAEELRTLGAEWGPSVRLGHPSRQREIRGIVAAYCCNDPAGTLLAWRGFALHQRQSRLGDALLLPAVPQIQAGMMFEAQATATEPFRETDHAAGYYFGFDAKLAPRARLAALHYDNRADPLSLKDGNYGWATRFNHVGAELDLPARLGLIVQWLGGTTAMGPVMNGAHVVDNAFDAYMLLLTRQHGRHRWALRFDDFSVSDRDTTPLDDNTEEGYATSISYRLSADDATWTFGVEWVGLALDRPARVYFGDAPKADERLVRVGARYRLRPSTLER